MDKGGVVAELGEPGTPLFVEMTLLKHFQRSVMGPQYPPARGFPGAILLNIFRLRAVELRAAHAEASARMKGASLTRRFIGNGHPHCILGVVVRDRRGGSRDAALPVKSKPLKGAA